MHLFHKVSTKALQFKAELQDFWKEYDYTENLLGIIIQQSKCLTCCCPEILSMLCLIYFELIDDVADSKP